MSRPAPRARRSRYSFTARLSRSLPAVLLVVFTLGVLFGASAVVVRTLNFLHTVTGTRPNQVVNLVQDAVQPAPGTLAYKLAHNQPINILVLGEGGQENDAPTLTDTMMAISIDPASKRIVETSIPRDLWVSIDAWTDGRTYAQKINVANEIGSDDSYSIFPCCKKPQFTGRDGGGHLAEAIVQRVTGIQFDRYVTVDFIAFRDIVDALGGITVHMDGPLDDCHYPDYHDGYINHGVPPGYPCPPGAGIHFPAGDYQVNGEQALELARSRDASEAAQATDFARAKRQQMIILAIRKKALSANAIDKLPQILSAIEQNVRTDIDVTDMRALYNWGGKLPDSSFIHVALTNTDLLQDFYNQTGTCGEFDLYRLCALDPTFGYIRFYLANTLLDPSVLAEQAPIQIVNATGHDEVDSRVINSLRPFGLNLVDPLPGPLRPLPATVILDYTGGADPSTARWLGGYFKAPVQTATAPSPSAGASAATAGKGFVVELGRDFAARFYGLS
jgi:anionic cell wall polymer biosynthesis LytR-Cps2A-Psr (LCP) family protein